MRISFQEAIQKLNSGEIVAIPTETVYGLAARFDRPKAVEQVFFVKNRPPKNPLILHIPDARMLEEFVKMDLPHLKELIASFWPGPLTLVLPLKNDKIPAIIRAGLPSQAFRLPAHPLTLELIRKTGPLVAPSANLSGRPSAVIPEHVEKDFGMEFPILEGGETERGIESTILLFFDEKWHLGRLGALPAEAFQPILNYVPAPLKDREKPLCPGQLYRHYAPTASLTLKTLFAMQEVIIGFSDRKYPKGSEVLLLGSSRDAAQVLHNLYTVLRTLDERGIGHASIDIDVPNEGLWQTFLERVRKASLTDKSSIYES